MKEILTIQVGQCGNQVGLRYWDVLQREHSRTEEGSDSFFATASGGVRRARAILVDSEEGVVSQVLRGPLRGLFDRSSIVTDVSGAGNNWAHGYMVYGPHHAPAILDRIRLALEACESPQAFVLLHSLGGGTGSGLGSYLLEQVADAYPEPYRFAASLLPGDTDDVVTSPYNALLSASRLVECADVVFPVENQALIDVLAAASKGAPKEGPGSSHSTASGGSRLHNSSSSSTGKAAGGGGGAAAASSASSAQPAPTAPPVASVLQSVLDAADSLLSAAAAAPAGSAKGTPATAARATAATGTSRGRGSGPAAGVSSSSSRGVGRGGVRQVPGASKASGARTGTVGQRLSSQGMGSMMTTGVGRQAVKPVEAWPAAEARTPHTPSSGGGQSSSSSSATAAASSPSATEAAAAASEPSAQGGDGEDSSSSSPSSSVKERGRAGTAWDSMNDIVARMLADLTSSMRFKGTLNLDLNEVATTLVPFPRMHFLSTSLSPLRPRAEGAPQGLDALVSEALVRSNMLVRGNLRSSMHLACGLVLRGRSVAVSDVMGCVKRLGSEIPLVPWNPDGFKVAMCSQPSTFAPTSALLLSNNRGVAASLGNLYARFLSLYRVRAHLHHYLEYMDGSLFLDAAESVNGVVQSYEELS